MKTQKAKLIYASPVYLMANGIRYSHDNHHLSDTILEEKYYQTGEKDFNLIKRVGFKFKHESVLEHSLVVLEIEASRALLQELSRHRIGISPTVKSTRYTLTELKNEEPFIVKKMSGEIIDYERVKKYVVLTKDEEVNESIVKALENTRQLVKSGKSNDIVKFSLPEAFKFKGQYSINLRALINLLKLRIHKDALWEFRELSKDIIDVLPKEYKELILLDEDILKNYEALS